jgi:hypothetical protein
MQNFPPNVSAYRPGGTGRGHGPRAVAEVLATGSDPRRDRPTCINLYKKNAEGPDGLSTGCHCAHHRFPGFRGGGARVSYRGRTLRYEWKIAATVRYRDPAGSRLPGRSAISARRAAMRTRYPSDPRRRSQPVVLVVNPTPSASRHLKARLRRPSQNAKIRLTFRTRKVNVKKAKLNRPHRAKPLPGLAQLHNCVLRVPTVFVAQRGSRARGAKVPSAGKRRAARAAPRLPRDTLRRRAVCLSGCALSSLHQLQLECGTHQLECGTLQLECGTHQLECGTHQLECGTGTAPLNIPEALPPP